MIKKLEDQSLLERIFEGLLWKTRYVVVTGVLFAVISSIALFLIGSYEIIMALIHYTPLTISDWSSNHSGHATLLVKIIGAIDLYLIGVVLMIFGFGIYELFISKIDIARDDKTISILEIENLDELKNKIIKVIIMVLIVSFFERVLEMHYHSPLDMLYFSLSIFGLSFGVYLINKNSH